MQNLIVMGKITATSKKGNELYENRTKTAYIELREHDSELAEEFGLQKYTTKDGNNFFIVKLVEKLVGFIDGKQEYLTVDVGDGREEFISSLNTDNFYTDKEIMMNIIKAKHEKTGTTFYRLQALNLASFDDIIMIRPENPFI